MMPKQLQAMLETIRRRVLMSIARAVVRAVNDESARQTLKIEVLKDELIGGVERMQNYGFTSHPHAGADAGVVFVAGNRDQGIVLAVDDRRYRIVGMEQGEVAMYDDLGQKVALLRDKIQITAPDGHVEVSSATAAITANVTITGDVSITGDLGVVGNTAFTGAVTANGKNISDTHKHGGVTPGSGTSGQVT